jgi:putative membrane protein
LIAKFIGAIDYSDDVLILFWSSLILALLNLLVKPILNILLTPINFLTLGAFRWIINLIILLLVSLFVPEFKIIGFIFPGMSYLGFVIPSIRLTFFWSIFLVSFLLELLPSVIYWLVK